MLEVPSTIDEESSLPSLSQRNLTGPVTNTGPTETVAESNGTNTAEPDEVALIIARHERARRVKQRLEKQHQTAPMTESSAHINVDGKTRIEAGGSRQVEGFPPTVKESLPTDTPGIPSASSSLSYIENPFSIDTRDTSSVVDVEVSKAKESLVSSALRLPDTSKANEITATTLPAPEIRLSPLLSAIRDAASIESLDNIWIPLRAFLKNGAREEIAGDASHDPIGTRRETAKAVIEDVIRLIHLLDGNSPEGSNVGNAVMFLLNRFSRSRKKTIA